MDQVDLVCRRSHFASENVKYALGLGILLSASSSSTLSVHCDADWVLAFTLKDLLSGSVWYFFLKINEAGYYF